MSVSASALKPRRTPVQARSAATVEMLHVAAVQILIREGLGRCTTTRIAERAGISVGSLYQYYPNRDALLAAVLERHLEDIANAVERTCRECRGAQVGQMGSTLTAAFLGVKLREPQKSKALHAIAQARGGTSLARTAFDVLPSPTLEPAAWRPPWRGRSPEAEGLEWRAMSDYDGQYCYAVPLR